MRIGIKYCGGCNPRFNRRVFVERLIDDFIEASFEPASEKEIYDIVLVVCGCSNACASYEKLSYTKIIIVSSEQEYAKTKSLINNFMIKENVKSDL